jgi:tetratricopeptide (TPR) repeat protein
MQRKDYILRVIHEFLDALLRVFNLREAGQYDDALKEIEDACQKYLGLNAQLIAVASDSLLLSLLTLGDRLDTRKCLFLAKLLSEQAQVFELKGEQQKSFWSYTRALSLYAESLSCDGDLRSDDNIQDVAFIRSRLEGHPLSAEQETRLARYDEKIRQSLIQ